MYQARIPFEIRYWPHVDVNGFDFARAVGQHIKKIYGSGVYFCCGQGATGFKLLYKNQVTHMSFVDQFAPALDSCLHTAMANKWSSRVSCFSSLQDCKHTVDLLIADPPWWPRFNDTHESDPHRLRQLFDIDYVVHKSMWQWAVEHVTPMGDIFVSRDNKRIDVNQWKSLIPKQFKIVNEYQYRFFKPESVDNKTHAVKVLDHSVLVHLSRL